MQLSFLHKKSLLRKNLPQEVFVLKNRRTTGLIIAGAGAGLVNGLFGAGGGMILIPLLRKLTDLEDRQIFSMSVAIILPICLISLGAAAIRTPLPWTQALPYLLGSGIGGWLAARHGARIPVKWLHRGLGVLILWGGIRYLCS